MITKTIKYKNFKGESKVKTFKVKDYRSALDCLQYVVSGHAAMIKEFAECLTPAEVSQLKSLFAPSRAEKTNRRKESESRKKALDSKKFERETEALISQMVSHSGFLSNSPF